MYVDEAAKLFFDYIDIGGVVQEWLASLRCARRVADKVPVKSRNSI